ncbi:hypothetical protein M5D96_000970, partial [Drosophila gunungcola]
FSIFLCKLSFHRSCGFCVSNILLKIAVRFQTKLRFQTTLSSRAYQVQRV